MYTDLFGDFSILRHAMLGSINRLILLKKRRNGFYALYSPLFITKA